MTKTQSNIVSKARDYLRNREVCEGQLFISQLCCSVEHYDKALAEKDAEIAELKRLLKWCYKQMTNTYSRLPDLALIWDLFDCPEKAAIEAIAKEQG